MRVPQAKQELNALRVTRLRFVSMKKGGTSSLSHDARWGSPSTPVLAWIGVSVSV